MTDQLVIKSPTRLVRCEDCGWQWHRQEVTNDYLIWFCPGCPLIRKIWIIPRVALKTDNDARGREQISEGDVAKEETGIRWGDLSTYWR